MKGLSQTLNKLNSWQERVLAGAYAVAQRYAADGEAIAKREAKWQDRTAQARQRIRGKAFRNDSFIGFQIIHGVGYGVYLESYHNIVLERRRQGRYAILKPTVDKLAPEFLADIKAIAGLK